MEKSNYLKRLVFALLILNFNIFDSCCVVNGDSEYEDIEREGNVIPGRLLRAGKITYTADDIIAYALKVTLNDISESLNTEEGKRYFETQEGKAKFLKSMETYFSGDTTVCSVPIREMKNLLQNPHQVSHDDIMEYVFYTSEIFQVKSLRSKKSKIQSIIDYYNRFTDKFNNSTIRTDYYYRVLGINELNDGCNLKDWNFNDISSNYNKTLILHIANGKI